MTTRTGTAPPPTGSEGGEVRASRHTGRMPILLLLAAGRSVRRRALRRLGAYEAVASAGRVALVTLALAAALALRTHRPR
jgi:hypothetical protein